MTHLPRETGLKAGSPRLGGLLRCEIEGLKMNPFYDQIVYVARRKMVQFFKGRKVMGVTARWSSRGGGGGGGGSSI